MFNRVTIVIPVYNLNEQRQKNFNFLFEKIKKLNCDVIIAEQASKNKKIKICDNIHHNYFNINSNIFNKSKLLNLAAKNIKTKYIWFIDADLFLNYEDILKIIDDQDVIKPFKCCIYLDKEDTLYFIENKQLVIKKQPDKILRKFGALSIIIKSTIFNKIKFDERYEGYGFEDMDIAERILDLYNVLELPNIVGLHLYHEVSEENPLNFQLFKSLF